MIKKCLYTSAQIKKKWELAFLTHMTDTEKEDCHINEYLWHAFTYGKMNDYLEGKDAIKAFNNETKDEIYIFWQLEDNVYHLVTNNKFSSKHLRLEMGDVYVVDSNFTWTFFYKHCDRSAIWYKVKK